MLVKFDSDFIFCSAACMMTNHLYAGMSVRKSIPHTGSVWILKHFPCFVLLMYFRELVFIGGFAKDRGSHSWGHRVRIFCIDTHVIHGITCTLTVLSCLGTSQSHTILRQILWNIYRKSVWKMHLLCLIPALLICLVRNGFDRSWASMGSKSVYQLFPGTVKSLIFYKFI